jgi:hypothetical protein
MSSRHAANPESFTEQSLMRRSAPMAQENRILGGVGVSAVHLRALTAGIVKTRLCGADAPASSAAVRGTDIRFLARLMIR